MILLNLSWIHICCVWCWLNGTRVCTSNWFLLLKNIATWLGVHKFVAKELRFLLTLLLYIKYINIYRMYIQWCWAQLAWPTHRRTGKWINQRLQGNHAVVIQSRSAIFHWFNVRKGYSSKDPESEQCVASISNQTNANRRPKKSSETQKYGYSGFLLTLMFKGKFWLRHLCVLNIMTWAPVSCVFMLLCMHL